MKKIMYIVLFLFIIAIIGIHMYCKDKQELDGSITLSSYENKTHGISVYDIDRKNSTFFPDGSNAFLLNSSEILVGQYDKIVKYDLISGVIKDEYAVGTHFDYFTIKDKNTISFSRDKEIIIFDLTTNKEEIIVSNNGSKYHSWNSDGTLIYSTSDKQIILLNPLTLEKKEVCKGTEPICSKKNIIAYKDINGQLNVFNYSTQEKYQYRGNAYYYCFSPTSSKILIEDEMKAFTAAKNFLKGQRVIGHRVVVWDYTKNVSTTIFEACESGVGEGFSWWYKRDEGINYYNGQK